MGFGLGFGLGFNLGLGFRLRLTYVTIIMRPPLTWNFQYVIPLSTWSLWISMRNPMYASFCLTYHKFLTYASFSICVSYTSYICITQTNAIHLWCIFFHSKSVILSFVHRAESSPKKCVNCSQLKMISNTVFWGKFLFYTVFLISILSLKKNHTVYLTWIVTGTVFFVWIKGSIPRKIILTKEKYSIYEHSCCNYCNFWKQTPLMFF